MVRRPGLVEDADAVRASRLLRRADQRNERDERQRRHPGAARGELPDGAQRWLHGGVGNLGGPGDSSSGHTMAFLPSCHWKTSILCPTWRPSPSTLNAPNTVFM